MKIECSKSWANQFLHYSVDLFMYYFKEGRRGPMGTGTGKFWILDPLKSQKLNVLQSHFQHSNALAKSPGLDVKTLAISHIQRQNLFVSMGKNQRPLRIISNTAFVILSLSTKPYLLMVQHRCQKVVKGFLMF